ncbi:DNA replication protein DnaD (plasmid) [Nostoc flagelliforme CCNUN1]|uniref:DNA replication protein DnaD n=1 Tax=Nostoc flagelliforme CCNUN1 TaxID=2038116 RepID=A0A2K8T9K9_9NOSO|nr:hypothetical protein [Nostoc flagelliforme]AUB44378.1 DNA replication protein DnaD [Nostoc flagelliforme CCNUN1]
MNKNFSSGILTGHPVVDAVAHIKFEGDITPKSWYKHICYQTKSGEKKADRLAIDILADIVYWYRPYLQRNELTGEEVGWKKKFKEDVLRRNPDAFAESLNASPRCVRESMHLLSKMGLIKIILQPVQTGYGVLPNVMHIDICPEALAAITYRTNNSQNAQTLEKSLLTKWVTSNDQTSNKELRNGEQGATKCVTSSNEISNLSIYRDFIETSLETSSLSLNPSLIPNHSEEEKEKEEKKVEFGFQIPIQSMNSSSPSLSNLTKTLQPTSKPIMKANVPPSPPDPFFSSERKKPHDVVWDWLPDGPWRNDEGKLDVEFHTALASRWMKDYGGDLHANKAKVLKHFRNDPTNLPIEWEWYQSTFIHRVANIQTRRQHGLDTSSDEQAVTKQSRAVLPLPQQMRVTGLQTPNQVALQVADYALPNLVQNLVSIASVQHSTPELPRPETSPPPKDEFGAVNDPNAYLIKSAKPEEVEFWASRKPNVVPLAKKLPVSHEELAAASSAIEALKAKKVEENKTKKLTSITEIVSPPIQDDEAVLQDMRKYLHSDSDVLRQKAIDWASNPINQCQIVKKNGQIIDIKWIDF